MKHRPDTRPHALLIALAAVGLTLVPTSTSDITAGSGTAIATIEMGSITIPTAFPFECDFTNGLTIVTTSTSNITVIYE